MGLREWLSSNGYENAPIDFSGKIKRFSRGDNGSKNAWVVGFKNSFGGKTYEYAVVGDWSTGEQIHYKPFNGEMGEDDHEKFRKQIEVAKKKADEERAADNERASSEAKEIWEKAGRQGRSAYLDKKGLEKTFGAKFQGSTLLIPCRDEAGKLWGIQKIQEDGEKRFLTGQRKKGTFHLLSEPSEPSLLCLCEGFATGGTIAHCYPTVTVAISFDAGNLEGVAQALRRLYPHLPLVICADNDQWGKVNVGLDKARVAAEAVGGRVATPCFDGIEGDPDERPTDWNDLFCLRGIDEVRRQLLASGIPKGPALVSDNEALARGVHDEAKGVRTTGTEICEDEPGPGPHVDVPRPQLPPGTFRAEETKEVSDPKKKPSPAKILMRYLAEEGLIGAEKPTLVKLYKDDFYRYTGTHWALMDDTEMKANIQTWMMANGLQDLVGTRIVGQIMDSFQAYPYFMPRNMGMPHFSPDPSLSRGLIPLKNGLLSVERLIQGKRDALLPHAPDFFCTYVLPFEFNPDAKCPLYDRVALEILGSEDQLGLMDEVFGIHLYPEKNFEKFIVMQGEGRNGKSVLLRILASLLGDENVSSVALEDFSGGSFMLHQTMGKFANIVSDVQILEKADEGLLKRFVSREPITVNRKYKEPITFRPFAIFTMACNQLPAISDRSDGIWNRMIAIQFNNQVLDESKQDKRLVSEGFWEMGGELPGIFNRALLGLARVMTRGFIQETGESKETKKVYRHEMNPIAQFVDDMCEWRDGGITYSTTAYEAYKKMCLDNGMGVMKQTNFTKGLVAEMKRRNQPIEVSEHLKVYGRTRRKIMGLIVHGTADDVVRDSENNPLRRFDDDSPF